MEKFFTSSDTLSTDFVFHCHDFGHLIYWQKHGQISIQVRQEKQERHNRREKRVTGNYTDVNEMKLEMRHHRQ